MTCIHELYLKTSHKLAIVAMVPASYSLNMQSKKGTDMIINGTTFELLLRKHGMTQAALAQRTRLGTKTIGRIRRGEELRLSNAEKIAAVLGVSLEELQLPPSEKLQEDAGKKSGLNRLVADLSGQAINTLTLTSLRYKVPEDTILEAGPFLFMLLAELNLKRRRDKLEAWKDAVLSAAEQGPRHGCTTIEDITNEIWNLYHQELESIAQRDLSGGFRGLHPRWRTPENPGHSFHGMLEDIAAECGQELTFEDSPFDDCIPTWYDAHLDAVDELFDPENEYPFNLPDEDACFKVAYGEIPLRDMPKELLTSGTGPERRAWAASHPKYHSYSNFSDETADLTHADEVEALVHVGTGGSDA